MHDFFLAVWQVLLELAPWLLLGAAIGGMLHVALPASFLRRQLSGRSGVLKAVGLGVPLPLCSCGVIPVGLQLKKSGASDGAVVAFLISTPQTGADSILVSASMLGWPFAIFKLVSAAATGIVGGWLTDASAKSASAPLPMVDLQQPLPGSRLAALVSHGLELLRSIWGWLVFGVVVSAAITAFMPPDALVGLAAYGGLAAMGVTLVIAVPLYVCATASVPIAAALVASGLPTGAALVFLMAGPATNVATLGAVYRTLGRRPLAIYLATIIVGSIACGWAFEFVISADGAGGANFEHEHVMNNWWRIASAAVLVTLIVWFAAQDLLRLKNRQAPPATASGPTIEVGVAGMTCGNCVAKLEKTLTNDAHIDAAAVTLEPGQATVHGKVSEDRVRELIQQAGFQPR
ncbi:MAG: permease [Planctomycetes bacterium]|nr:permease [Planctomycetota bacterium]